MTDNEIIEQLKEHNPFLSGASPLPWGNSNPDLQQLSRETSEEIEQLMRTKRREPALPLAGLILGTPGSGKTHMLTRILRKLKSNGTKAIFVTVRAFKNPLTATQHLLSEIFISMKQTHSNGKTQFDMLMSEFIASYDEHRRNDDYEHTDEEVKTNMRKYLALDMPGIDSSFVKALILYMQNMNTKDPFKKMEILKWISEGLENEDSMALGLPPRDLTGMSDDVREQEAENTLVNLGLVLAYSKVLMIVCFDQLEEMKSKPNLIAPWGNLIHLLVNNLWGVLPLCFVSVETWNQSLYDNLDDSVKSRLKNNEMTMKTCTIEQAKQLIRTKIKSAFDDETKSEEISKFLLSEMKNSIKQGYSPRFVIELANEAIKKLFITTKNGDKKINLPPESHKTIFEKIKEIYNDEYKKIQSDPESWPPDTDQLALALETWLEARGKVEFSSSTPKHMKLKGIFNDKTSFAFIIVTIKNNSSALAGGKRAVEFLEKNPGAFSCYITEKLVYKQQWKHVGEKLNELQNLGGHVIFLDENSRIQWYAVV
ncbi:MAG: ATP-binding protein, partial [Synergistaceae bacterium]|nr:ATP-binding protein [Synergistaceae bacterium]